MVCDRADAFALPGLIAGRDEVEDETVFEQADAFVVVECAKERSGHRLARRVAVGVDDAVLAVPAFFTELDVAVGFAVDAQAGLDQIADPCRALLNDFPNDLLIAQARASGERVL